MKLPDVNVLVGAFRQDVVGHAELRSWLEWTVAGDDVLGLTPAVMTGVVRVLTHSRVFAMPDSIAAAVEHVDRLRAAPGVIEVRPGERHWDIFRRLCIEADARGNLVSDAGHAALAIEHGATWVTLDRDFARFAGLRWEVPVMPSVS
jgi:toxin-antitoxin system PIN domain toxin